MIPSEQPAAELSTAEKRALIRKLRSRAQPMPYRDIGKMLNLSAVYVRRLHLGLPSPSTLIAPLTEPKTYRCRACKRTFASRAKEGPQRCKRCGSYDWRGGGDAEHEQRAGGSDRVGRRRGRGDDPVEAT